MNAIARITGLAAQGAQSAQTAAAPKNATAGASFRASFADVLKAKTNDLRFSAHAQTRMKSRGIDVSPQMMDKLTNAVDTAQQKGSKNSLVLFSNAAFIVNVPNRTVVTAMDGENIRENIFTNIDSTVLAG
jgi:flagellar operon protein